MGPQAERTIDSDMHMLLDTFAACPSYTDARRKYRNAVSTRLPMQQNVSEIVDRLMEGWTGERPPLDWYAEAIIAFDNIRELPSGLIQKLASAANYYGDSELALEASNDLLLAGGDHQFHVLKYKAKAEKNRNNHEAALNYYRQAFGLASERSDRVNTAYFLLLYSKLCDHFEQRFGWHRAYNTIAYGRLKAIRDGESDGASVERWLQICRDSRANIIYQENPAEGERFFSDALGVANCSEDSRIRVSSHLLEQKIELAARSGRGKEQELSDLLDELYELAENAGALGNRRAWNVRRMGYLRCARIAWQASGRVDSGPLGSHSIPLLQGVATDTTRSVEAGARAFGDTRTEAQAIYERARWRMERVRTAKAADTASNQDQMIEDLLQAHSMLTSKRFWASDAYQKVVRTLGSVYIELRDWGRVRAFYEEAYDYYKVLLQKVEEDEKLLDEGSRSSAREIDILGPDERRVVRYAARDDYRILAQRALELGERLHRSIDQERQKTRQVVFANSLNFRFHALAEQMRLIEAKEGEGNAAEKQLEAVQTAISNWRSNSRGVYRIEEFSVAQAIGEFLGRNIVISRYRDRIVIDPLMPGIDLVEFDEDVLGDILQNLIVNVVEHARRSRQEVFYIRLCAYRRNE